MKIQLHDAYYTFDWTAVVNDCYSVVVDEHGTPSNFARHMGISDAVVCKFFRYKPVSFPTFLAIASACHITLMDYIIYQD